MDGKSAETTTPSTDGSPLGSVFETLFAVQTDRTRHWVGTILALVVGLLLVNVHWTGLILGGVLVGIVQPKFRRAVAAGVGFGVIVLVVFVIRLAMAGALDEFLRMGRILLVTIVPTLLLPLVGSLVRGLFHDVNSNTDSDSM